MRRRGRRLSLPATLCLRRVTDQTGLRLACACAPADLEEKIPWTAVKKSWNTRRGDWVNSVNATLNCVALSKLLVQLRAVEQEFNTTIMCPERLQMLRQRTAYLPGLWERASQRSSRR